MTLITGSHPIGRGHLKCGKDLTKNPRIVKKRKVWEPKKMGGKNKGEGLAKGHNGERTQGWGGYRRVRGASWSGTPLLWEGIGTFYGSEGAGGS